MKKNETISAAIAASRPGGLIALAMLCTLAAGCAPVAVKGSAPGATAVQSAALAAPAAVPPPAPAAPGPAAPPRFTIVSLEEAVASTTRAVFSSAPAAGATNVVIDPLIDGTTGYQSKATQSLQSRIVDIVKREFPRYSVQRITPEALQRQPRVLVGTFTPVDAQNKPAGERESFWFCLVLLDLASNRVVARAVAHVRINDADATPTATFRDSPAWTVDPAIRAYVANCQGSKVGDPINPQYFEGLLAAALLSEAGDAYDEGRYGEALQLYSTARKTDWGDQLRVYNGLYLSLHRLGRAAEANAAFRDLVDYGFRKNRLALKFLFRPGSVRFAADNEFTSSYELWLGQIAAQALERQACLRIIGHTSAVGPAALNDGLSLLRAEYVQSRIENDKPVLRNRMVAAGVGSRENLIGTARDDASDMLDRRVEINPVTPCGPG